ncbi:hypothetical protein F5Y19DRAFT_474858 [Xylariaceae sp. FL1651]|nr:hypothetical protein F5Y19DRAFT_474858 [Xylariaceae sp. FL1651]
MSFGFGVGDFIAGANLAHKLIRVMTETRGASIEYQEALAELCGIQQVFIQITQLSRNEILPKATLNSLAQIIMPSMGIIADFLDRTKHYQTKLSGGSGLSSSWLGWALFRKDELKLLRDTLHSRLSAINTLLAAANHLPAQRFPALPDSLARFEVADESAEYSAEEYSRVVAPPIHYDADFTRDLPTVPPALASFQEVSSAEEVVQNGDRRESGAAGERTHEVIPGAKVDSLASDLGHSDSETTLAEVQQVNASKNGVTIVSEAIQAVKSRVKTPVLTQTNKPLSANQARAPVLPLQQTPKRALISSPIKKTSEGQNRKNQDVESYLQSLFETAITIQADAEAKAKAAQRAAEEAEWRQRIEENIRLKAEADIRERINRERLEAEQERLAEERRKMVEQATMEKLMDEAERAINGREKALLLQFKDAVGRKFSFPFHLCRTWQGMEELIKQAFIHVEVIGPHVLEGHYDLIGPNGEIILPQIWEKVIQPDWAITMHMWPMDRSTGPMGRPLRPQGPGRGLLLSSIPSRIGGLPGSTSALGGMAITGGRPGPRPPTPGPPPLPPPPRNLVTALPRKSDFERDKKKKSSIGSFLGKRLKGLRYRRSSITSGSSSDSSLDW